MLSQALEERGSGAAHYEIFRGDIPLNYGLLVKGLFAKDYSQKTSRRGAKAQRTQRKNNAFESHIFYDNPGF
jgi:hypothetical protein